MAIRPIRKVGDPILRMQAKKVEKVTEKTRTLIDDMFETLYDAPGVGLAAPQIGVSLQVIVIDVDGEPIALVNPEILEKRGSRVGEEGCLSVPNESIPVERADWVKVRGLNPEGELVEIVGENYLATALQHEIDHLHGVLIIDRIYRETE